MVVHFLVCLWLGYNTGDPRIFKLRPAPANTVPAVAAGLNYLRGTKGMHLPMAPGITAEVPRVQTTVWVQQHKHYTR